MPKPFDPNHGLVQPSQPNRYYTDHHKPLHFTGNDDGDPGSYPPHTITQTPIYKKDQKGNIIVEKAKKVIDYVVTKGTILPGFTSDEKPSNGYDLHTGAIVGFVPGDTESGVTLGTHGRSPDPSKAPVQQDGPFKGYHIAQTAYMNRPGDRLAQSSYLNAKTIPYIVGKTSDLGKIVIVHDLETGQTMAAIVGDTGNAYREGSIALIKGLGYPTARPDNSPDEKRYVMRICNNSRNDDVFWKSPSAATITDMANKLGVDSDFSVEQQDYDAAKKARSRQ